MKWLSVARCEAIEVPEGMEDYCKKWIAAIAKRDECTVELGGVTMAFVLFEYDYFESMPRASQRTTKMLMNEEARFAMAAKYAE